MQGQGKETSRTQALCGLVGSLRLQQALLRHGQQVGLPHSLVVQVAAEHAVHAAAPIVVVAHAVVQVAQRLLPGDGRGGQDGGVSPEPGVGAGHRVLMQNRSGPGHRVLAQYHTRATQCVLSRRGARVAAPGMASPGVTSPGVLPRHERQERGGLRGVA